MFAIQHFLGNYYEQINSRQGGPRLPAELASTVGGVDHLPGVALGPGWEHSSAGYKLALR